MKQLPTLENMADEHDVDMGKFLVQAQNRIEALRKLGADVLPPNLVYPPLPDHDRKGEQRCIKAWWDLGETGLLLYMDLAAGLPFNTEIEFRILDLRAAPYSSYVAPEADLDARNEGGETDNTPGGKRTLKLEDAEDYITGWVSFDGRVTLTFPGYPFEKDDNGNPRIELNWHDVDRFSTTLREIVRRVTYEAAAGNWQIAEELGVDFGIVSPYTEEETSEAPAHARRAVAGELGFAPNISVTPRRRPLTAEEHYAREEQQRLERQQQENAYYEDMAKKQRVGSRAYDAFGLFLVVAVAALGFGILLLRWLTDT